MLIMTNDDLLQGRQPVQNVEKTTNSTAGLSNNKGNDDLETINNEILELKKMKDEGLVTEEEFEAMRTNVLFNAINLKKAP